MLTKHSVDFCFDRNGLILNLFLQRERKSLLSGLFFKKPRNYLKKVHTGIRRIYSAEVDKKTSIMCDQVVLRTGFYALESYPEKLRRVKYYDQENDNKLDFTTNKTQIWIAVSVYALVAIIKKRLKLDQSLYTILQIFSVSIFQKMPMY
jgi:hypothetical protein